MEESKVSAELVHISDKEFEKMTKDGTIVVKLSKEVRKEIFNKYYGGYSGTPSMGHAPNAVIIKSNK